MDYLTPVLLGIGLSMDRFAVALAIGASTKSGSSPKPIIIAASFSANTPGGCDAQSEEDAHCYGERSGRNGVLDTNHETKS